MAPDFAHTITRVEAQFTPAVGRSGFVAGGQLEWTWAVGMPYRVLADPQGLGVMPMSPADTVRRNEHGFPEGNFEHGLGYFAALQSFLTYSFGWTRHDRGLLWWYDNGQPVDDSRFALLKAVWDADGMLLRYLAWCVERASPASLGWLGEPLHRWVSNVDHEPVVLSPSWRERLAREAATAESDDLCTTPWGKHLEHGDHIGAPSGWDWAGYNGATQPPRDLMDAVRLVGIDSSRRQATFVSDHVGGWYEALARLGGQLRPLVNDRNWRIDVFVKPIGYLGQYRQSRTTSLWFAGRHKHHTVGN